MSKTYIAYNGPKVTTAAPVAVTSGVAIKTMQQLATPSTQDITVIEWGISFDGTNPSAVPIKAELIQTDVAATVTAYVAGDIVSWGHPNDIGTALTLGTAASGYTATAEGATAAARLLDIQLLPPTVPFFKQFPLGREPQVPASKFLRVRVTAGATVNLISYVIWEE
jgi:hypothetical protein